MLISSLIKWKIMTGFYSEKESSDLFRPKRQLGKAHTAPLVSLLDIIMFCLPCNLTIWAPCNIYGSWASWSKKFFELWKQRRKVDLPHLSSFQLWHCWAAALSLATSACVTESQQEGKHQTLSMWDSWASSELSPLTQWRTDPFLRSRDGRGLPCPAMCRLRDVSE